MTEIAVAARGIHKSFGALEVLKDVSLEIAHGTTSVIIGPSGSGKSTLLRCLNLLEPIAAGSITFYGRDITGVGKDAWQVRREIGMVFQSFDLFAHLTALENIALAPMKVKGESRAAAEALAHALLAKVRIPEKAHAYPDELSGGQQQRVAIARALAMRPKLLLYDEPTSALDPEMIKEVLDVIQQLSAEGMTSVIVTHEMGFARRIADRVVFMDAGAVVADTTPRDFFEGAEHPRAREFLAKILHQ